MKNYLITGVSRGLGLGFTRQLLAAGHRVIGCSRKEPSDLPEDSGRFDFFPLDVSDATEGPDQLRAALTGADLTSLTGVILNAGILGEMRDMSETSLSDLRHIAEVNLWSNKWIMDTIFDLKLGPRQLIAISSGASVSGSRGWNGYSISKAGLNMMIQLYAGEQPDTHFTSLAPGLINTAMQDYLTNLPSDDRFPTVDRLKQAKGTPDMPDADTAAGKILNLLPRLFDYPSGSFVDIRKMGS